MIVGEGMSVVYEAQNFFNAMKIVLPQKQTKNDALCLSWVDFSEQ